MQVFYVEITGVEKLIAKLNAATREDVIKKSLQSGGIHLSGWSSEHRFLKDANSKFVHPTILSVRTDRLRSNMLRETAANQVEKSGNEYTKKIGTNVHYGKFHEFGTQYIRPRPFLRPALADKANQTEVLTILRENIEKAIEDAG